jgi:hypothetical protein
MSKDKGMTGSQRPGRLRVVCLTFAASLAIIGLGTGQTNAAAVTYNIGDTGPGGGVVFITPSTPGNATGQYFEARRSGISLNSCIKDPNAPFTSTFSPEVNTRRAIGDGRTNSADIAQECRRQGASETLSLFTWIETQTIGGFTDWFIPNRGEADRLAAERTNPAVSALLLDAPSPTTSYLSNVENNVFVERTRPAVYLLNLTDFTTGAVTGFPGGARAGFIARMFTPGSSAAVALRPTEYELAFDANGGTCNLTNSGPIIDGTWITVPTAQQCSRAGYTLLGWNPRADGGDPLGFDPGGWTVMTGDNTLYAIWVPIR